MLYYDIWFLPKTYYYWSFVQNYFLSLVVVRLVNVFSRNNVIKLFSKYITMENVWTMNINIPDIILQKQGEMTDDEYFYLK